MTILLATLAARLRSFVRNVLRTGLAVALLPILLLVLIGTLVYSRLEGWTILESLYATIITVTTVGYGDFSPQTFGGRLFAIVFTLSAIGFAGYAISTLAAVVIDLQTDRIKDAIRQKRMKKINALKDHIIICGATIVGHRAANELLRRGTPFVLIEANEEALKWALLWMHEGYLRKRRRQYQLMEDVSRDEENMSVPELAAEVGVLYLLEDATDEQALIRAGIGAASGVIAAMDDDRDNMAIALSVRDITMKVDNQNIRVAARANNEMNIRRLYLAGANHVIAPNFMGGFQMATHMLSPVLGDFMQEMMFRQDRVHRFFDMPLREHPAWVGKTVGALNAEADRVVLAIKRDGDFIFSPNIDIVFQAEDILIVLGAVRE